QAGGEDDLGARERPDPLNQGFALIAIALDHRGQAVAAQLAQGGIYRKSPGAARPLWSPIDLVARGLFTDEIGVVNRKGPAVGLWIPDGGEAAILRHVQPFVAVGRPTVGEIHSLDQRVAALGSAGEQAER